MNNDNLLDEKTKKMFNELLQQKIEEKRIEPIATIIGVGMIGIGILVYFVGHWFGTW